MNRKRSTKMFDQTFTHMELAVLCRDTPERLEQKRVSGELPYAIQYKKINGEWLYTMSFSTHVLISGLIKLRINRILDLISDAEKNRFLETLQKEYNEMNLENYS